MPRSFDLMAESSSTVEQVHRAYGDEKYWRARLAATDNGTLRSLTVDEDGTVNMHATFSLLGEGLPKVVTQLRRGDLDMVHHETWSWIDADRLSGEVSVELPGAPVSTRAAGLLTPVRDGSQLTCTATVAVRVPLVGGTIEGLIGGRLTTLIRDIHQFTTVWIADRG